MSTSRTIHSLLPTALHPFVTLSYPVGSTGSTGGSTGSKLRSISTRLRNVNVQPELYGQGPKDVYFVAFCAFCFTILREIAMRYIFARFARWWLESSWRAEQRGKKQQKGAAAAGPPRPMTKIEKRRLEHTVTRFAEQGWSFLYCTVFWSLGMYILTRLHAPLSPESLWGSYPPISLPPATKFYYLAQLGWWFHQIYVINTEKRRGDHWQMFGHHILTITLLVGSYKMHFTRVGTLIHTLMDFCDIVLPVGSPPLSKYPGHTDLQLAKMLRYLSLYTACDAMFVVFLVTWFISRQVGLAFVIHTSAVNAPKFIPFNWDPSRGLYLTSTVYYVFIGMLSVLYILASVWFYMACMVAIRVIRGLGAEDTRSDDEGEEEGSEEGSEDLLDDVQDMADTVASGRRKVDQAVLLDGAGKTTASRETTDDQVRKRR